MRVNTLSVCLLGLAGVEALALPPPLPTVTPFADHAGVKRDDAGEHTSDYLTSYASSDVIPTTETVKVKTSPVPTGTAEILPTLSDVEPHTTGVIITELDSSKPPLMTRIIATPTSLLQPLKSTTKEKRDAEPTGQSHELMVRQQSTVNIFDIAISNAGPPSAIPRRSDHPVPRKEVRKSGPVQTNKFYSSFFLGDQTGPAYTFPYSVAWSKGKGPAASWGIAISHTEPKQRNFGPVKFNGASQYYINPVGIQSMIMSAKELGKNTILSIDQIGPHSARINLKKDAASFPAIQLPLVQGMPYVTGTFVGGTPLIQSGVYFKSMTKVATNPKSNVVKYNFLLEDGTTWRVYGHNTKGQPLNLKIVNNGLAESTRPFTGTLQITKDPKTSGSEKILDESAGVYPTGLSLTGSVSGTTGSYSFRFQRAGHPTGAIYMYALPHHVASFDSATRNNVRTVTMSTPTKGTATLVRTAVWTMIESNLPTNMGHAPWDGKNTRTALSASAKAAIKDVALLEVSQDMNAQANLDSMYFSGKALLKFAQIVYVINDLLGDKALGQAGLAKLKQAYSVFSRNQQKYPLVYESAWGGVVSSATYATGDPLIDFGNTYYNDHHFHYGYHILAAAYIGYLDPSWVGSNRDYVNTLVRDIANPTASDTWFPQHRNFDWYHGHSWAHGLFPALDGKNQESSSEDIMAIYAIKMWGQVSKSPNMVHRANLQLSVMTRSLQNYYLYTSDNKNHPSNFIGNKVAGVLFENKVDHTTFFSPDIEAIQGIHMIPVHAPTALSRSKNFVKQEWDAFFSNGRVDKFDNAWKSIIYANYATIEPKKAWNYFNSSNFKATWIDGGASRTWYMAYAAALGGL